MNYLEVRERWRARLASGEPFDERTGLALLSDFGVPVVRSERAESGDEAVAAAERIGWPVAVKTAAPGVHKSDFGGVRHCRSPARCATRTRTWRTGWGRRLPWRRWRLPALRSTSASSATLSSGRWCWSRLAGCSSRC